MNADEGWKETMALAVLKATSDPNERAEQREVAVERKKNIPLTRSKKKEGLRSPKIVSTMYSSSSSSKKELCWRCALVLVRVARSMAETRPGRRGQGPPRALHGGDATGKPSPGRGYAHARAAVRGRARARQGGLACAAGGAHPRRRGPHPRAAGEAAPVLAGGPRSPATAEDRAPARRAARAACHGEPRPSRWGPGPRAAGNRTEREMCLWAISKYFGD
jgi:hypothetical protein